MHMHVLRVWYIYWIGEDGEVNRKFGVLDHIVRCSGPFYCTSM